MWYKNSLFQNEGFSKPIAVDKRLMDIYQFDVVVKDIASNIKLAKVLSKCCELLPIEGKNFCSSR